jgi:hypothetical protein
MRTAAIAQRERGGFMSGFLPEKSGEKLKARTVFMSDEQWERMKEIAESTKGGDDEYDRQEVIRYACDKLYAEFLEHRKRKR